MITKKELIDKLLVIKRDFMSTALHHYSIRHRNKSLALMYEHFAMAIGRLIIDIRRNW